MKRILFISFLFLSLVLCFVLLGWAGGIEDFNAAFTAKNRGDYDEAIRLYTQAIASGDLSQENLSIAYNNRGNTWQKKGDSDRAMEDYDKAIKIDRNDAYAYNNRGLLWEKKGDSYRAITDYDKAIELDPRYAHAYNNRGLSWYAKGDYNSAIADYTKAIELDLMYTYAYVNRGKAWYAKRDYDHAFADYSKAIKIDPNDADAYDSFAWFLAVCRKSKYRDGVKAVSLAKQAVELEDTAGHTDTLAAAYAESGEFQDAIKTEEEAIAKLKKEEGNTKDIAEFEKHLASYKSGKPWRDRKEAFLKILNIF
jgi:tetratricopeptide (TPR) repeat protein